MDRSKVIVRTSVLGIIVNVLLVAFKAAVGFVSGSIAVMLDALNNLGDALSSVVTIVGAKLAGKRPNKKHPYGYGRIEYLSTVVVAVIILVAGANALRESIDKIIHPEAANYTVVSLVIIAVAVAVKLVMGRYVRAVGKRVGSQTLVASGRDALFDAVLSFSTLVGAVLSLVWGLNLEGWLGAAIAVFILKAGVEMLLETLHDIIGVRADPEFTQAIRKSVLEFPEVRGAYDLSLHNYGPTDFIGSVHIEVPDDMTARQLHRLTREISSKVYREHGVLLTVGIYASNTSAEHLDHMRNDLEQLLRDHPEVLQMHGFYAEQEEKRVAFDLVVDFDADAQAVCAAIRDEMKARYPGYEFFIVLDSDYAD